jgi:hypothetical protein
MSDLGKKGPKKAVRAGGGFRSGNFGSFNEEHMMEQAEAGAMQQFGKNQQASDPTQSATGKSAIKQQLMGQQPGVQKPPKEMGNIWQEVFTEPPKRVLDEIKYLVDLHRVLNINSGDTLEERQKKEVMVKRLGKLDDELRQVVQQKYKEKMQVEKAEEEEKERNKQREEQKKREQSLQTPTGKSNKKGLAGMSGKQRAKKTVQMNRQKLGSLSSSH